MFEAAVSKFAKSVGDGVIHPSPTLDQNENCSPLKLVVKKNRKWSWQSPVYQPSPFTISQVLQEENELGLTTTEETALSYNKIHKLSVKGKVGAKIKILLDMELDGSDTVDVEAKLGTLNRVSVDETKLLNLLTSRHINMNHEFIKQVREHPRKVLCVVVSSYRLKGEGTISAQKEISGEEKAEDEKIGKAVAEAEEDVKVEDDNTNSMVVPANTVVAYRVCELLVRPDKSLELIIDKDSSGGFKGVDVVDSCGATSSDMTAIVEHSVEEMFSCLLTLEASQKEKLVKAVLQICNYPKDVDSFLILTKKALALAKETTEGVGIIKDTHISVLKDKFLCPDQDWAPLLQTAGFSFIADGTVVYPKPSCTLLEPLVNVFKSLVELEDEQLMAVSEITSDQARPLIYLLAQTLRKKTLKTDDPDLCPLYADQNPGQSLLSSLDFQVSDQGQVLPPVNRDHQLQGASRALYALYWKKEYDKNTSHWCHLL